MWGNSTCRKELQPPGKERGLVRQGPEEHRLLTPGQASLTLPSCSARASGSLPQAPAQQRPGPRVYRSLLVSLGHSSALPTSPSSPEPFAQRCQSALGFESLTTLLTAGHGAWVPRVERAATSRTQPVPIPEPGPVHTATEPARFRNVHLTPPSSLCSAGAAESQA